MFTNCGFKPSDISEILRNEEYKDILIVNINNYEDFSTSADSNECEYLNK